MKAEEYAGIRKELGLTQEELAKEVGLDQSVISRRERGVVSIDREASEAILRLRERVQAGNQ